MAKRKMSTKQRKRANCMSREIKNENRLAKTKYKVPKLSKRQRQTAFKTASDTCVRQA